MMYERIARLKTPDDCEQFAINVEARGWPELALAARLRAVKLRAAAHSASSPAERDALEAVFAYESARSAIRGKKVRGSQIWGMIKRYGILPAVERVVTRKGDSTTYLALVQMGMHDMAFEAVVLRHADVFSPQAVEHAQESLRRWAKDARAAQKGADPTQAIYSSSH